MKATEIKKVACAATGVIGSSWATNFAMKGYPVNVYDISEEKLASSKEFVEKNLNYLKEKGLLTQQQVDDAIANVIYTTDPEVAFKDVQYIQESGPENYEIKKKMLAVMEEYAPADAVIASSTSGLKVSEIAKNAKHPERCVGSHPYNPPHMIPLVEVSRPENASEEAAQCAYDFYKLLGKEPILLKKEALGFIANRLQIALWREATELVHRGVCTVEDIDKSIVFGPGLRWALIGPGIGFQLSGGPVGIEGLLHHLEPSWNLWLDDMADWHAFPYETWPADVQKGIDEEKANRDDYYGKTDDEIIRYRDDALLELLKIHKKL